MFENIDWSNIMDLGIAEIKHLRKIIQEAGLSEQFQDGEHLHSTQTDSFKQLLT